MAKRVKTPPEAKTLKNHTVALPVDLVETLKRRFAADVASGKISTETLYQDWFAALVARALKK